VTGPPGPVAAGRAVRVLGLPVALVERSRQHHEALEREFRLIAVSRPVDRAHIAARLLDLVDELSAQFDAVNREQQAAIDAALAAGDDTMDLVMDVPRSARDASLRLGALLEEADDFCRAGDLLTLATPADCVALRRFYLGEVIAQLDGADPVRWDDRPR
jgi:hypothetical protein